MAEIEKNAGLIWTKYSKPGINQYLISRQRLHQKLDNSLKYKLTMVIAPAGYGKTTAVLDWLGKCGLPAAWLSLDSYDNNPVVFWRYVCTALDGICNGISKDTEYVFSSLELLKANIHINIFIDRLWSVESDFLLVLDDFHLITDSSILHGLSYLIDYLPSKMHLVFISRRSPDLELARHSIKWQIQRLDEKDLRFRNEEIFRFYQARGYTLENDDVKKVETYTEGWAAALVAVAMSMEDADGSNGAIAALSRSSRDIDLYLKNEVISTWRPEKRIFAIKTCILDVLSEALCDAVTGDNNGRRMLKEISEGNSFLTAVDNQGHEYQYHHLFKSFLYKLLSETDPEQIPGLHTRAAQWFRERGFIPEAIEHFLCGGSHWEAFEMIENQIDHLIHRNDFGMLLSWIERLPEEYKNKSFKTAVIYALYYAEIGRYDLSRQWVEQMKTLREDHQYSSIPRWNIYSRTVCTLVEANLLIREGNVEYLSLLFSAAETNEGKYYKMSEYNDFNTADIFFYRCPINLLAGLFREDCDQYERMTESYRGMISKNPGYAPLGIGEYLYESNRLEESLPYLLKAIDEAVATGCPGALVPAMVDIARIKRAKGDLQGAFEVLIQCENKLQCIGKAHWNYLLQAFRCRLSMDAGDVAAIDEWFISCKLSIFTMVNRTREYELIVYARALMVKDRTHDAEILLRRLLSFTEENGRLHSRVEVLNLMALLAFKNNHMRLALGYIDESLHIGMKEGYVRSYLDELSPMAQILRAYIKSRGKRFEVYLLNERKTFAASLLKQLHESLLQTAETHDLVVEGMTDKILDQLTSQEKKVLELIVNAATNKEISEELGISLRTVKTHTGNIYGKLGLKNRAQCVKLVRELELL